MFKKQISVRGQLIWIFTALMLLIFAGCIVMNLFFLPRYYLRNQKSDMYQAYSGLNKAAEQDLLTSDEFLLEWKKYLGRNGISAIVLNMEAEIVSSSGEDADMLSWELQSYYFGGKNPRNQKDAQILIQEDNYHLQIVEDPRLRTKYLEAWGVLKNSYVFMLRTPMESIDASVKLSTRFMMYTFAGAFVVGILAFVYAARSISRPIHDLTEISSRMKGLNFEAKFHPCKKNTVEVDELGRNINELSEILESTISELKTANNELQRDLERKDAAEIMRREFVSSISHEMKTPLAVIKGYAEGLRDGIASSPEDMSYYSDVILDETDRMSHIVSQFLTLNELEFGNNPVTMTRFDVCELIRNVLKETDYLIRQQEVTILAELPDTCYVWADEFGTELVLSNYLSNALHYASGEKRIEICVSESKENEDTIRVGVMNTGENIPEESLPRLWEKFYKVDKARTRAYGGSGVGLSIVKAVMDSMHRAYGADNLPEGVSFWFELGRS